MLRVAIWALLMVVSGARAQSLGEVFLAPEGDAPGGPEALAFDGRNIWVARPFADAVVKLSARNGDYAGSLRVERPSAVLHAFGALWVANTRAHTVVKLHPDDGKLLGSYAVGYAPAAMTSDGEAVWV